MVAKFKCFFVLCLYMVARVFCVVTKLFYVFFCIVSVYGC